MNTAWIPILSTIIGASSAIITAIITLKFQARSERKKWYRDLIKQVYCDTIRSISNSLIIPIGTEITKIENWYKNLSSVRENLLSLQIYSDHNDKELDLAINEFYTEIEKNDFLTVASLAKTIRNHKQKSTLQADFGINIEIINLESAESKDELVLISIGDIRRKLTPLINIISNNAKMNLGKSIII